MAKEYMMTWEQYKKYNNSGIYSIAVKKKDNDAPVIVYVGKSKNMYKRVLQHVRALMAEAPKSKKYEILHNVFVNHCKIQFDVLEYCEEDKLDELEKEWINCIQPALNTVYMNKEETIEQRLAANKELAWLLDLVDVNQVHNWEE